MAAYVRVSGFYLHNIRTRICSSILNIIQATILKNQVFSLEI